MSRNLRILFAVGVVAVLVMLYFFNPVEHAFMPKCLLKAVTGYNCPGCGFQRALHATLHGNFVVAARYNLFLLIGLPYLLAVIISDLILQGEARRRWQRVTHSRFLLLVYVVLALLWWIVRNLLGI